MKEIPLTRGQVALVDDEDFEYLSKWKWFCTTGGYAGRTTPHDGNGRQQSIKMHRQILGFPEKGLHTDHINLNKLDNRRCNLRVCTNAQNQANKACPRTNQLGAKGVYPKYGKFCAQISVNNWSRYLGIHDTLEAAKAAYDKAAIELRGEFARLN